MASFDLEKLVRPNIWALEPYRCARDDYQVGVLLDANENTIGPALAEMSSDEKDLELNRYPDPHQAKVKQLICNFRNSESTDKDVPPLKPENLFVGVGSDEVIDAIIRALCVPAKDSILTCPPTYGMYSVCATVNDVKVVKINQIVSKRNNFELDFEKIYQTLTDDAAGENSIKIVYVCSPGNPAPSLVSKEQIIKLLNHPTWNGIVIADEAYIDFAPPGSSLAPLVTKYPNLLVMQTISKSFGLAGARFGISYSSVQLARVLNSMKAPYNISSLTSQIAERAFSPEGLASMKKMVRDINEQREMLIQELPKIEGVGALLGGTASNFILFEILNKQGKPDSARAKKVYTTLAQNKAIVVRFRGTEYGCEGALRMSVGTSAENQQFLKGLADTLQTIE